jgi:hypothetical protein
VLFPVAVEMMLDVDHIYVGRQSVSDPFALWDESHR